MKSYTLTFKITYDSNGYTGTCNELPDVEYHDENSEELALLGILDITNGIIRENILDDVFATHRTVLGMLQRYINEEESAHTQH